MHTHKSMMVTTMLILVAFVTLTGRASAAPPGERPVAAAPAEGPVGTQDFFHCPDPIWVQREEYGGSWIVLERCWSTVRNTWMYRGNIYDPVDGDELRVRYVWTGNFVEHSYRRAPNDLDEHGNLPGEWYLAGEVNGSDIQACLTPVHIPTLICSQPH